MKFAVELCNFANMQLHENITVKRVAIQVLFNCDWKMAIPSIYTFQIELRIESHDFPNEEYMDLMTFSNKQKN